MIDLYAITDDPAPPLPEGLSSVATHGLAVVCGPAEERELTPDVLWRHEEVVEALMEGGDLLPVRFGTRLDDETAALEAIAGRHRELASALDRVRGAVELSVRALGEPADTTGTALSGAEYLRAKASSAAAHEDAVRTVHRPLDADARASRELPAHDPAEVLRAAYLVDRERVELFAEHVGRLQAENPGLQLLCTGPWPPYSFAQS